MKKLTPFLLLLLSACATSRTVPHQELPAHAAPYKIFGIGNYNTNSVILTLVDANNMYFVLEAPVDTNFKVGQIYP